MSPRLARSFQLTVIHLTLVVFLAGCGISSKPRQHWWQFWRSKPQAGATTSGIPTTDPNFGEPAPPLDPMAGVDVSPLGPDGMPIGGGAAGFGGAAGATGLPLSDPIRANFAPASELTTVYFGFDSFEITGQAQAALDNNANWIRNNPSIHVQIEGHADERGTLEYNLNLGQLRADMVREYLVSAGVEAARLHPISYGEERPQDTSGTEQSHQLNRRVQFLVFDPNVMP